MPTVVVSDKLTSEEFGVWANTRRISLADAHREIAALKAQSGRDIFVDGSRTRWTDLLEQGLVDELHLLLVPLIAGAGTRMFDGRPPGSLKLLASHSWHGSGIILARYGVERPTS